MANKSRLDIIEANFIGNKLDAFRDSFTSICEKLCIECSLDALDQIDEGNTDRLCQRAPLTSIQISLTSRLTFYYRYKFVPLLVCSVLTVVTKSSDRFIQAQRLSSPMTSTSTASSLS